MEQLQSLKTSAGFTDEDARYLRIAGEVLKDQTSQIVAHWRSGIIAGIPNLARHSRTPDGQPIPKYLAKSNLRFEQWILGEAIINGVPAFGLPKIRTFVGRICIPASWAAPLWSIIINNLIPFASRICFSLCTVSSTECRLSMVTTPLFDSLAIDFSCAEASRTDK
jgi:hypothetical protein